MAAIPEGSEEMVKYNCANVSRTAGPQNRGSSRGRPWCSFQRRHVGCPTSDEVCGTASAGPPPELPDYRSAVESSG